MQADAVSAPEKKEEAGGERKSPRRVPSWVWPVAFVVAVGGSILLSGLHDSTSPTGLPLIHSPEQYEETLKKADGLFTARMVRFDSGQGLSDADLTALKQAGKLYEELSAFMPTKTGPYYASARVHMLLGEVADAEREFRQAIDNAQLETNAANFEKTRAVVGDSHYWLAQCYEIDNNWAGAYDEINQAISINATTPHYYYVRARAEVQLNFLEPAKDDLKHVLDLDPTNQGAQLLMKMLDKGKKKG